MPLSSRLFKGDRVLEACLVRDQAHILQDAAGDHVRKIHAALKSVDDARIDGAELSANKYGRSTASAVLEYKKKRRIINHAYQTQADDIVGKLTIAALDREMFLVEIRRRRQPLCGDPVGPATGGVKGALSVALNLRDS